MATRFENQVALIAVGVSHSCVLGYQGAGFASAILDDCDSIGAPADLMDFCPDSPGVYLWRGSVALGFIDYPEGSTLDVTFEGAYTPATLQDLADFCGKTEPPPPFDPDDREQIQEGDYHLYRSE